MGSVSLQAVWVAPNEIDHTMMHRLSTFLTGHGPPEPRIWFVESGSKATAVKPALHKAQCTS